VQGKVLSVNASSGCSVTLDEGRELTADRLVVAAGAWSNQLLGQLEGKQVPMTAKRGYHSMISKPGIDLDLPIISNSRGFVMTPLADGLRLAGTAEFARLDSAPDYRRAQVLVDHARDYLPGLNTESVSEWMGQRPMMSDSVPVIGPSPRHRSVFYAFGHGHYGLTQGPTTGRMIADLLEGRDPGIDVSPYRMERFR
jgi:D-amino-acid dehydrogenase